MKIPPGHDKDEDSGKGFLAGVHPTDLGIVIVAAIITFGFVYLMLTPQNWRAIDTALAPDQVKPAAQQQKKGETQMILFDAKKK